MSWTTPAYLLPVTLLVHDTSLLHGLLQQFCNARTDLVDLLDEILGVARDEFGGSLQLVYKLICLNTSESALVHALQRDVQVPRRQSCCPRPLLSTMIQPDQRVNQPFWRLL
jgi:hypothetical protein